MTKKATARLMNVQSQTANCSKKCSSLTDTFCHRTTQAANEIYNENFSTSCISSPLHLRTEILINHLLQNI